MPETAASGTVRTRSELIRYLAVGAWNTMFGYACFAAFTALLNGRIPEGYIVASLLSNVISVTVSFLGYKWFVFRTAGNYFREWLRCLSVYSFSILFSLIALPAVVHLLRRNRDLAPHAPYIAGAVVIACSVVVSYFGHKHFSFRAQPESKPQRPALD